MSSILRRAPLLVVVLLSACATVPKPEAGQAERQQVYEERAAGIAAWTHWGFKGRLALDNGDDGGSGQLDWQTRGDRVQLDFRGTLGRGAWRLSMEPGQARLERADGSELQARSVEELVQAEIGWSVPVDALAWWVRGLRAPGEAGRLDLDESGRIMRLNQAGWDIEFERYRAVGGAELPGRIEAVSGDLRLKLVPARWATPAAEADSRA